MKLSVTSFRLLYERVHFKYLGILSLYVIKDGGFQLDSTLEEAVKKFALPFKSNNDLTPLIDAIGDAKIVLLGEASHGTSEFYTVRAELSKRLIEEKGFSIIAVEGDWPSSQHVNRYIKGYGDDRKNTREVLKAFNRWPTWMWANNDVVDLVDWLKSHNDQLTTIAKNRFLRNRYLQLI